MEVPLTKDAWLKDIQVQWNRNRGNIALFLKKEWNKKRSHLFYAMASTYALCQGSYSMVAMLWQLWQVYQHYSYQRGNFAQNRQDKTTILWVALQACATKNNPMNDWSKISLEDYLK